MKATLSFNLQSAIYNSQSNHPPATAGGSDLTPARVTRTQSQTGIEKINAKNFLSSNEMFFPNRLIKVNSSPAINYRSLCHWE